MPHRSPWVQIAAVNQEQTKNTMFLIPGMLSDTAISDYGIDLGKEIIYSATGQIQAVTSSPLALEGGRPSFFVAGETQHWLANNEGHAMAKVARRNLGKSRDGAARSMDLMNAHAPGLDSVAEWAYDAWRKITEGRTRGTGLLYESREAPPETDLADPDSLRAGLKAAYGDAHWVDLDRLIDEIYDPETPPSEARRFYLNQIVAAEDAWTTAPAFDSCQVEDQLSPGNQIVLGFDGSRSDDATALVAVRVSDGLLDVIDVWEKPEGPDGDGWQVPRDTVDGVIERTFAVYQVAALFADLKEWESYIDVWSERWRDQVQVKASRRSACGFDMRTRIAEVTRAAEALNAAITDRTLIHTGHPVLRRHILNARRRPNRWGVSFGKEHRESPRKVDALAASLLARIARTELLAAGPSDKRERTGEVWAL